MKFRHAYTAIRLHRAAAILFILFTPLLVYVMLMRERLHLDVWGSLLIDLPVAITATCAWLGYAEGGKDEPAFLRARLPFWGCFAAAALSINDPEYNLLLVVSSVLFAFLLPLTMRATVRAVRPLAEQRSDRKMIARCNRADRLFGVCAISCAILSAAAHLLLYLKAQTAAMVLGILAAALLLVVLIVFIVLLGQAKQMLPASGG